MLRTASWSPDLGDLAIADGAVWTSSGLFRIDPASNEHTGPNLRVPSGDVVGFGRELWASDFDGDVVRRFDARTHKVLAVVKLPPGSAPEALAISAGSLWVACHHSGMVARVDLRTNRVTAEVSVGPPESNGPQGIAAGMHSIWVDVPADAEVVRIDEASNQVRSRIAFPNSMVPCGGIAVGRTAVWVSECLQGTAMARIDPGTNRVVSVFDTGGRVVQPTAVGDSVWFVTGGDPDQPPAAANLVRLRADDTAVTRVALPRGFVSGGVVLAFGSVWISDFAQPRVLQLEVR